MRRVLPLLAFLSGCYLWYPNVPKGRLEIVPGATAEIPRDSGVIDHECGTDDTGACEGKAIARIRVTSGHPSYDGKKVSHYHFRYLVDPQFRKTIAKVRSLKSTCNISIAPTILSGLAVVAGLYIGSEKGENYVRDSGIAVGVAAGFYALSYPLGGYACMRANKIYDSTGMDTNARESFVHIGNDKDERYVELLQELAAKFNENPTYDDTTPVAKDTETAPMPADDEPPTVGAATDSIVDAMKKQGNYLAFLTIVECAGKEEELSGGDFTVLAFDDDAIRKMNLSTRDKKKFKENCAAVYDAHVSTGSLPVAAFTVGATIEVNTRDGKSHQMKIREGHRVIEATNGVVYSVDEVLADWR